MGVEILRRELEKYSNREDGLYYQNERIAYDNISVKKALEGNDTESIKQATEKLTGVFYELSEKLYKQANPNAGAEANASSEGPKEDENGNVYDADYNVEDSNNQ